MLLAHIKQEKYHIDIENDTKINKLKDLFQVQLCKISNVDLVISAHVIEISK